MRCQESLKGSTNLAEDSDDGEHHLHRGVNGIGGNNIIVQDGDTCFSFDFGAYFGRRYDYFEECLKPLPVKGLLDLMYMGLLPPLQGIYRQDLLPSGDSWVQWRSVPR